jgi:hypothetical protein
MPKRLRFVLLATVGFIASLGLGGYFWLQASANRSCEIESAQTVSSPDRIWKVKRIEQVCDLGLMTDANWIVSLENSAATLSNHNEIFAVDDSGPESRPEITWTSDHALHIETVPTYGFTNLQLRFIDGIRIWYTYRSQSKNPVAASVVRMNTISEDVEQDALSRSLLIRSPQPLARSPSVDVRHAAQGIAYRYTIVNNGRDILVSDPANYDPSQLFPMRKRSGELCDQTCHRLFFSSSKGPYGG